MFDNLLLCYRVSLFLSLSLVSTVFLFGSRFYIYLKFNYRKKAAQARRCVVPNFFMEVRKIELVEHGSSTSLLYEVEVASSEGSGGARERTRSSPFNAFSLILAMGGANFTAKLPNRVDSSIDLPVIFSRLGSDGP